jgi:hypothetical protein
MGPTKPPITWRYIFINPERHVLRSGWRVVVFSLIFLAAMVLLSGAVALVTQPFANVRGAIESSPLVNEILSMVVVIPATLIATGVCFRYFDRRRLRTIGFQFHASWWRDYLFGTGIATVMMAVIVGTEQVVGAGSFQWSDAHAGQTAQGLLISFVFFNVAAASEELMFRGYPLQTLLLDIHPAIAVIVPSVLFGLAHLGNPDPSVLAIVNTSLAGIWLSVAYLRTRSLWFCTSLHYAWNWAMNSIFGLNVSGMEGVGGGASSLFSATQTGPEWVTGGSYGPEGGVLATALLGVTTFVIWRAHWLTSSTEVSADRPADLRNQIPV